MIPLPHTPTLLIPMRPCYSRVGSVRNGRAATGVTDDRIRSSAVHQADISATRAVGTLAP
jgi:hypothetical protein